MNERNAEKQQTVSYTDCLNMKYFLSTWVLLFFLFLYVPKRKIDSTRDRAGRKGIRKWEMCLISSTLRCVLIAFWQMKMAVFKGYICKPQTLLAFCLQESPTNRNISGSNKRPQFCYSTNVQPFAELWCSSETLLEKYSQANAFSLNRLTVARRWGIYCLIWNEKNP